MKRVFQAVDDGSLEDLKKLLSCKRYANVRDRCGRSLLHRAILKKHKPLISFLLDECAGHVALGDTVRSCGSSKDCSSFLLVLILSKACKIEFKN